MNTRFLPALLLPLLGLVLSSCSTFNDSELATIQRSGISPRTYGKMADGKELRPEDVIEMTRRHVPDRFILRQIDDAGVDYVLSPEDHKKLKRARVSPAVIDALVVASNDFSERYSAIRYRAYVDPYPYYYDDPYYYGYGGGPYFGGSIGIGYSRYHHDHHHHRH